MKYTWKVLLLATLLCFFACDESSNNDKGGDSSTLKIGAVLPLTGDLAGFGPVVKNSLDVAVDEINANGGLLGKQIEVVIQDSKTSGDVAPTAAQKLIDDGVQAIIGAAASGVTSTVIPIAKANKVVLVSPSSTNPLLTNDSKNPDDGYFFRTAPSDKLQAEKMVAKTSKDGQTTAAVLYIDNSYGLALAEAFRDKFKETNGTDAVLNFVSYPDPDVQSKSDYTEEVTSAFANSPQVVALIGYGISASTIMKNWDSGNFGGKWIFTDGVKDQPFIDNSGSSIVNGMIGTAPSHHVHANYDKFVAAYTAKAGSAPGVFAEFAYDALMVLAEAIKLAGEYNGEKIKAKMIEASTNYTGASGKINFDSNGDITDSTYEIWKIENGKFVFVETI